MFLISRDIEHSILQKESCKRHIGSLKNLEGIFTQAMVHKMDENAASIVHLQ